MKVKKSTNPYKAITKCNTCGVKFEDHISVKRKYCSRKCYHVGITKKPKFVICQQCGKRYIEKQRKNNFCSRKCLCQSKKDARPKTKCECCGKIFQAIKIKTKRRFCSMKCTRKIQAKNRMTVRCGYCGKEFTVQRNEFLCGRRYCSRKCFVLGLYIPRTRKNCLACGHIFWAEKMQLDKQVYCSNNCKLKHMRGPNAYLWKGGPTPYYGPHWEEIRQEIIVRDNSMCQVCGKTSRLEVHHLIPIRLFCGNYSKANQLRNLITLCTNCHKKIEPRKRKKGSELNYG